jgi:hypothetical protein
MAAAAVLGAEIRVHRFFEPLLRSELRSYDHRVERLDAIRLIWWERDAQAIGEEDGADRDNVSDPRAFLMATTERPNQYFHFARVPWAVGIV